MGTVGASISQGSGADRADAVSPVDRKLARDNDGFGTRLGRAGRNKISRLICD